MYRVLAAVLMAYAICYPRMAAEMKIHPEAGGSRPTRAGLLIEEMTARVQGPIDRILATVTSSGRRS